MGTEMQIDERPLVKTNNDQMNENRSLIPLEAKVTFASVHSTLIYWLEVGVTFGKSETFPE